MAFSFVKDNSGKIYGVWVAKEADANNQAYLITLFLRGGLAADQISGNLRVAPNRVDDKGGFFVMLGSYPAPGEDIGSSEKSAIEKVIEFVSSARLTFEGQDGIDLLNIGIDQTDFKDRWINLKNELPSPLDLSGAEFTMGFFPSMDLNEAILKNTTFMNCILAGGFWKKANLSGAKFIDTRIKATFFNDSNLSNATFTNTNFILLPCARADFTKAVFDSCKILAPTGLEKTTLTDTVFKDCEIIFSQDLTNKGELLSRLSEKQKQGIKFSTDKGKAKSGSGCFIATEIYEDFDSPEVLVFRKLRDSYLMEIKWGRLFIEFYYSISPYFVRSIRKNRIVRKSVKLLLDSILSILK